MKQVIQDWKSGKTKLVEIPSPRVKRGHMLIHTAASLVSAGTERMVVEFAGKNLLAKARSRPDLVRQVLGKVRREGVLATVEAVRNRLDQSIPLGYSSAGTILAVGDGVNEFQEGQRVACAGAGYAVHAEVAIVPLNLAAPLPDSVDFESASFTTLGSIALQGIRLADVKLGEVVAVIGLGLVGQLTVQMLKAAGCQVIGMDVQKYRTELARKLGADAVATNAEEMESLVYRCTSGVGADAVLITAATRSSQPLELAGAIARDKAVVVAVGAVGMTLPRKIYYEKELDFRISRSYGPGRYDPAYEEQGQDYPIGYVRWTENRNMQAFIHLLEERKVNVQPLISHRFPIERANKAYELITGKRAEPFLGVLIKYPEQPDLSCRVDVHRESDGLPVSGEYVSAPSSDSAVTVGLLGTGSFANATLLPAMKRAPGIEFAGAAAATGVSARRTADKFGFRYCSTDENEILRDSTISAVVIATRHHLHSRQVIAALNAGKHVFVEKPLALNEAELTAIIEAFKKQKPKVLMVGFNRRFAPLAQALRSFFVDISEPLVVQYRANVGYIPADHWTQDSAQGGGRIIGEACHFIDFVGWLVGQCPASVQASSMPNSGRYSGDNAIITLTYPNGSLAVVTYLANGDRGLGKERIEVHGGGRSAVLDDFRQLELVKGGRRRVQRSWLRQDKGHRAECLAFAQAVRNGGPSPISLEEIVATTRATFVAAASLGQGEARVK